VSANVDTVPHFEVSAIAFDLDGTLLDTIADLAGAVNALLTERGHAPLAQDTVRALVGKGMANLVRRALALATFRAPESFDDATMAAALARYQVHYAAQLGRATQPFPGLVDCLDRLHAAGFPLAIITNKATRFVRPHLVLAGIAERFDVIVGADDLPAKKPDPGPLLHVAAGFGIAPARLLMVGDSANDVLAARAAGCPVVVVPHGYREGRPVRELEADGIVASLAAVPDCVRYFAPELT
jgi:phosphoglycolate phosphatase